MSICDYNDKITIIIVKLLGKSIDTLRISHHDSTCSTPVILALRTVKPFSHRQPCVPAVGITVIRHGGSFCRVCELFAEFIGFAGLNVREDLFDYTKFYL